MAVYPTLLEREKRTDRASELLSRYRTPEAVKRFMSEFNVGESTAWAWMKTARDSMLAVARKTREEAQAELLNQLDSVILSPDSKDGDRVKALGVKARVMGLYDRSVLVTNQPLFDPEVVRQALECDRVNDVPTATTADESGTCVEVQTFDSGQDDGPRLCVSETPASDRECVPPTPDGSDVQPTGP